MPSLERSSFGDEEIGSRALTVHEQYMPDPRCLEEIEPLVTRTSLPAAGKTPHDFAPSVRVEEKAIQTADAAAGCRVAGAGGVEEYMLQHGYTDTSCSDPCPPSKRTSPLDDALVETRASIGSGSHSLSSQDSRSTSAWTDSCRLAPVVAEDHRQVRRTDEPRPDSSQTPSPPQPALPSRMPRGVRVWPGSGRASAMSSSFASGDSVSSRSLPMTPASLSASLLKSRSPPTPALPGCPGGSPAEPWWSPVSADPFLLDDALCGSSSSPPGRKDSSPKSAAKLDFGGYCCFRDRHSATCEAIAEERPTAAFELDVAILHLRSVLRRHAIEPSGTLVHDILSWQAEVPDSVRRYAG